MKKKSFLKTKFMQGKAHSCQRHLYRRGARSRLAQQKRDRCGGECSRLITAEGRGFEPVGRSRRSSCTTISALRDSTLVVQSLLPSWEVTRSQFTVALFPILYLFERRRVLTFLPLKLCRQPVCTYHTPRDIDELVLVNAVTSLMKDIKRRGHSGIPRMPGAHSSSLRARHLNNNST
ncbi:hypothetical protein J6590_013275 [Homalodisca vitripennis]|nr:hypothetical protein J6590_013275 [Homalodisca vitripennis]